MPHCVVWSQVLREQNLVPCLSLADPWPTILGLKRESIRHMSLTVSPSPESFGTMLHSGLRCARRETSWFMATRHVIYTQHGRVSSRQKRRIEKHNWKYSCHWNWSVYWCKVDARFFLLKSCKSFCVNCKDRKLFEVCSICAGFEKNMLELSGYHRSFHTGDWKIPNPQQSAWKLWGFLVGGAPDLEVQVVRP